MKTFSQTKEGGKAARKWVVVDATDKVLGRLATQVATVIRGKHKPEFTKHVDCGDFVVVVNASKIKVTGNKGETKRYYHHTGYIGGIKEYSAQEMIDSSPEEVITRAVKGMLPRGALGHQLIKKLKVYKDAEHPHAAQMPEVLSSAA